MRGFFFFKKLRTAAHLWFLMHMTDLYFLSRFPRFMGHQQPLWNCEPGYTAHDVVSLRGLIEKVPDLNGAPRSYEDFARASRAQAETWPYLYVHRLAPRGWQPGDLVASYRAHEGAQFVGNIVQVRERLDSGTGLARFRRISVGGNNRFDVPFPAIAG